MPILKMLPLGTVVRPKDPKPGWEDLRCIVTGYFPTSPDGKDYDYTMTPWPLGAVKIKGGGARHYYACNDDAIEEIESLGFVSEEGCAWMGGRS